MMAAVEVHCCCHLLGGVEVSCWLLLIVFGVSCWVWGWVLPLPVVGCC